MEMSEKYCEWEKRYCGYICFATGCGKIVVCSHGSTVDGMFTEFKYCPYCKKKINMIKEVENKWISK